MKASVISVALAALVLFTVSQLLGGIAAENRRQEQLSVMQTLLPGSEHFTAEPYAGENPNIVSVYRGDHGFVVETTTYGYAGEITLLVGVSTEGTVTGVAVRDLAETAGLGAKAKTDSAFLAQFFNTSGNAVVGETVDALTGATVTSRAIARAVNAAAAYALGADASSGATS